jgi:soluble lytic murein transglycosylase-like protein
MTGYAHEIAAAAERFKLDPVLVEAVVLTESAGRTHAYRYEPQFYAKYLYGKPEWMHDIPERVSASYGLMQIMYVTAREVGFTQSAPEYLFVPEIGLEFGCRKLRQLLDWAQGRVPQALAAYNGGKKANTTPPYRNQAYVDKVLSWMAKLR